MNTPSISTINFTPSLFVPEAIHARDDIKFTSMEVLKLFNIHTKHKDLLKIIREEFDCCTATTGAVATAPVKLQIPKNRGWQTVDGFILDRYQILQLGMRMNNYLGRQIRSDIIQYIKSLEARLETAGANRFHPLFEIRIPISWVCEVLDRKRTSVVRTLKLGVDRLSGTPIGWQWNGMYVSPAMILLAPFTGGDAVKMKAFLLHHAKMDSLPSPDALPSLMW